MSQYAERYAKVAAQFTARVEGVPAGAWERPAPCEGWVARDVVRHLVEWIPGFLAGTAGVELPAGPSVDDDPVKAWAALDAGLRGLLADPGVTREHDMPMGRMSLEQAVDMICTNDVFMHTWDLARATGQDETLDPGEVHRMLAGMEPMDEAMRASGHYGPRVPVPDDADEQTRLIAFIGRQP
jgi:uncharacterized protein (TIGR03086 family)